jgi:hypothetical protein
VREVRRLADPERQWAKLGEVLPVVERPADAEILGVPGLLRFLPGFHGAWTLHASDGSWQAQVLAFEASAREDFDAMLTAGAAEGAPEWLGIGFFDPEPGTLAVQGRELRTLRYRTARPEEAAESADKGWWARRTAELTSEHAGAGANVDATPDPPGAYLVLIQYSTPGSLERIGDDELIAFLDHFALGTR